MSPKKNFTTPTTANYKHKHNNNNVRNATGEMVYTNNVTNSFHNRTTVVNTYRSNNRNTNSRDYQMPNRHTFNNPSYAAPSGNANAKSLPQHATRGGGSNSMTCSAEFAGYRSNYRGNYRKNSYYNTQNKPNQYQHATPAPHAFPTTTTPLSFPMPPPPLNTVATNVPTTNAAGVWSNYGYAAPNEQVPTIICGANTEMAEGENNVKPLQTMGNCVRLVPHAIRPEMVPTTTYATNEHLNNVPTTPSSYIVNMPMQQTSYGLYPIPANNQVMPPLPPTHLHAQQSPYATHNNARGFYAGNEVPDASGMCPDMSATTGGMPFYGYSPMMPGYYYPPTPGTNALLPTPTVPAGQFNQIPWSTLGSEEILVNQIVDSQLTVVSGQVETTTDWSEDFIRPANSTE